MKVTFLPAMRHVDVPVGCTLLEAAQEAGIYIEASCGGHGSCGKCKVQVTKGNRKDFSEAELVKLTEEERDRGVRLACHVKIEEEMCVIAKGAMEMKNKISMPQRQERRDKRRVLGIAMDIGTTTVELQIYDMETKRRVIGDRFMNPQRVYGADVVSRITYCNKRPERVEQLQTLLICSCNESINKMVKSIGASAEEIEKIVVVCNTTMSHILVGESVDTLAKAPFAMSFAGGRTFSSAELPFFMSQHGKVEVLENIGGHVGSDAFGCILALGLCNKPGTHLLLDIGTNGEMVLAKDGVLSACSTAAGPAFEGAGIAYGMCAGAGAITKVAYDERRGFSLHVVENMVPVGISGSGVIDALACMLRKGVMDETGYIPEKYLIPAQGSTQRGYPLYQDSSGKENHILLTREDIRQIQMAKAAIYAGAMSLLEKEGVSLNELDTIYLAGAFGSHIDVVNAMQIGLLPRINVSKVKEVGNAALMGAKEVAKGIHHIELAEYESFKEKFIVSMNFFS